jgi:hypothetical protein
MISETLLNFFAYIYLIFKTMKKVISLSIVALVVAISLTSCKSHEKCPAYGKVDMKAKKSV